MISNLAHLYWNVAPLPLTLIGVLGVMLALSCRMVRAAIFGGVLLVLWGLLLIHHFH